MSREVWHRWYDRLYHGKISEPPYRMPPVRRFYTRVALGFGLILSAF